METWEQQLTEILEKEETLLQAILDEARLKTVALKSADIKSLGDIVNIEQPLAMRLEAAERKRRDIMDDAGLGGLSLSELTCRVNGDYSDKLEKRLKSMSQILLGLKRINALNIELTRSRLEFYDYLRGAGRQGYENDGRVRQPHRSRAVIDRKA